MQLSDNFTLRELERAGRSAWNVIPMSLRSTVAYGVQNVLQPIRDALDGPVQVTSGFRAGDSDSQHGRGEAADIVAHGKTRLEVWSVVRDLTLTGGLPVDQAIVYEDSNHVHVSWTQRRDPRGQLLVALSSERAAEWASQQLYVMTQRRMHERSIGATPAREAVRAANPKLVAQAEGKRRVYVPWHHYEGPLKTSSTASPASEESATSASTPDPEPAPHRSTEEAPLAINRDAIEIVKDTATEEGREVLATIGKAISDGVIDEDDAEDFRTSVWDSVLDIIVTVADVLTPLPDPWESATDRALEQIAGRAKARGPLRLQRTSRWVRALTAKNPRKLVALINEIEEADEADGVRGNESRRAIHVAARRLVKLDPNLARVNGVTFKGNQLFLDGEAYGEPPKRFKAA